MCCASYSRQVCILIAIYVVTITYSEESVTCDDDMPPVDTDKEQQSGDKHSHMGSISHFGNATFTPTSKRAHRSFSQYSPEYKRKIAQQFTGIINTMAQAIAGDESGELLNIIASSTTFQKISKQQRTTKFEKMIEQLAIAYIHSSSKPNGSCRILSTVAPFMSNAEIRRHFHRENGSEPTKYEITQARKFAKLYGPGGEPPEDIPIIRECVTIEDILGLTDFLHADGVTQPGFASKTKNVEGE